MPTSSPPPAAVLLLMQATTAPHQLRLGEMPPKAHNKFEPAFARAQNLCQRGMLVENKHLLDSTCAALKDRLMRGKRCIRVLALGANMDCGPLRRQPADMWDDATEDAA